MASWQCMFDGERAECTVVGGETHINRKLAGWLAGWLLGVRRGSSERIVVVLADAGRREHVQFEGGKERQGKARQGDDVARAAVDEDSARVELAVVL